MTENDKAAVSDTPEALPATPAEESTGTKPAPHEPPTRPSPPSGGSRAGLAVLLVVLILLTVGAGGYWLWLQLQQQAQQLTVLQAGLANSGSELAEFKSGVQRQVAAQLEDAKARAESREQDLRRQLGEMQNDQQTLRQQVEGQQQRLASLSTTSREDWLLAEAEYLLNIANQRVLMERTTENAVALLRSADERLLQAGEGTGDAELFAIRKALSRDLAALEAITPVDKEGLYLRLYALAESVDELPRLQIAPFPAETQGSIAPLEEVQPSGWLDRFWQALRDLAGSLDRYVRIDDVEAPAKPLVDSYATRLAALNVRLLLEQAQLAVLQEEPTVYRHSLEKAQTLLQSYYLASDENARLQAALAELAAVNVAPELPDISTSLTLLRDYLRQLHRVRPAPKGQL